MKFIYIAKKMQTDSIEVDVDRLEPEVIIDLSMKSRVRRQSSENLMEESQECKYCGKFYKSESTLHAHYALKHPENAVDIRCTVCDKKYPSLLSYQKHMRYKHYTEFSCNVCYRRFVTVEMLKIHQESCAKTQTPCPQCHKVLSSAVALRNHVKYMHSSTVSENKCDLCRRTFRSTRGLNNHLKAVHPPGTHCATCDRSFTSASALNSHNLHKHANFEYRCEHCSVIFMTSNGLERHYTRKHKNNHICCICRREFTTAESLINHTHT